MGSEAEAPGALMICDVGSPHPLRCMYCPKAYNASRMHVGPIGNNGRRSSQLRLPVCKRVEIKKHHAFIFEISSRTRLLDASRPTLHQ